MDICGKIKQNDTRNIETSDNQRILIKEEVNSIKNINEQLLETRKKGYQFNKKNKTVYLIYFFMNFYFDRNLMKILILTVSHISVKNIS